VQTSGAQQINAFYLTGASSAFAPLVAALQTTLIQAHIVTGDRFGGVAAALVFSGALGKHPG